MFGQDLGQEIGHDSLTVVEMDFDSTFTDTILPIVQEKSVLDHEVEYDAVDSIVFDLNNNIVNLYGEGIVKYGDITLSAHQISYDLDSYTVIATGGLDSADNVIGQPIFKQGKEEFDAKKITYNFKSEKGYIEEVKTVVSDAYVHAKISKKQPDNHIHVKGGTFTTCDKPNPHYGFRTTKMIVIPDDKIITGPGYLIFFNVIPIPIPLPFSMIPDQNKKSSGIILPRYGVATSSKQGFYLQDGGYYFAVNDYFHTSLLGSIFANGSWGIKSRSKYMARYKFRGNFEVEYLDYILGDKGLETDTPGRHSESVILKWNHTQDPKSSLYSSFNAHVEYSGKNGYRDDVNSADDEYINQNINSNISYKYTIPNSPFNLSLNAKLSQSIDAGTPESVSTTNEITLPQFAFNMRRVDLPLSFLRSNKAGGKKWWEKIGVNYNMNAENRIKYNQQQIDTVSINSSNVQEYFNIRNGVKHNAALSTSFKVKTISVSPSIRANGNWYFSHLEKNLDPIELVEVTDTINEFSQVWNVSGGVNLTGKLYGMYSFKKDGWIKAMRHQVTASGGVNYSPGQSTQQYGYIGDDGDFVSYSPYDGAIYSAPNSRPSNIWNFRLINDLEAKVKTKTDSSLEYKKVKFINNLTLDVSYDAMKDSIRWSDIRLSGRFTKLFNVVDINYNAIFDPYAYNNDARKTNESWLSQNNSLARIKKAGVNAKFSLRSKKKNKKIKPKNEVEAEIQKEYEANPSRFENLNIPWDVNVTYNIDINSTAKSPADELFFEENINHTLGIRGSFTIFKIFRISANTGYDFVNLEWNPSTIGLYVDLHCWELTATLRPNGRRQSYSFSLNVKSPLLKDLKIKKEDTFGGGSGFF